MTNLLKKYLHIYLDYSVIEATLLHEYFIKIRKRFCDHDTNQLNPFILNQYKNNYWVIAKPKITRIKL